MLGRATSGDLAEAHRARALRPDPHGRLAALGAPARPATTTTDHQAIVATAREAEATAIVVGLPLSLSGREGPAAQAARAEVEALRNVAGPDIEVVVHDERLTTVIAERSAPRSPHEARRAPRSVVDKVAAAVMLQSWLESGGK